MLNLCNKFEFSAKSVVSSKWMLKSLVKIGGTENDGRHPAGHRSRRRMTVSCCMSLVGRWRRWRCWIWCSGETCVPPWITWRQTSRWRAAGWSVRAGCSTGRRRRDLSTLSSCLCQAMCFPYTWSRVERTRSAMHSMRRRAISQPGQQGWVSCRWSSAGPQLIFVDRVHVEQP